MCRIFVICALVCSQLAFARSPIINADKASEFENLPSIVLNNNSNSLSNSTQKVLFTCLLEEPTSTAEVPELTIIESLEGELTAEFSSPGEEKHIFPAQMTYIGNSRSDFSFGTMGGSISIYLQSYPDAVGFLRLSGVAKYVSCSY